MLLLMLCYAFCLRLRFQFTIFRFVLSDFVDEMENRVENKLTADLIKF